MRNTLVLAAAAVLALGAFASVPAQAQKIDANGRCHDAAGRFAKVEVCGGAPKMTAGPAMTAGHAMTPAHTYKADAKGKCRDEKGHMAKKALCH
jgi:hypothetical protein